MAVNGSTQLVIFAITLLLITPSLSLSVHQNLNDKTVDSTTVETKGTGFLSKVVNFLWSSSESGYQHTWPVSGYSLTKTFLFVSHYLINFIEQNKCWWWWVVEFAGHRIWMENSNRDDNRIPRICIRDCGRCWWRWNICNHAFSHHWIWSKIFYCNLQM